MVYWSDVFVEHSANVMACSTAACEPIFDVAAIIAECTSIWTSFSLASYMVFFVLTLVACFNHTIIVVRVTGYSPSCSTSSTPCAYDDYTFGS